MPSLKDLISRLRELMPNTYVDNPDPTLCFRTCIERYLKTLDENVELVSTLQNMEISEAYVNCCLHLLASFANVAVPNEVEKPVFSVFQSQQLSKCLEFVICLGIYPLLSPGVSMPLNLRLENSEKFRCPKLQDSPKRHQKLSKIARCLDAIEHSSIDELRDLLSPTAYLSDYFAILLQLSYGPVSAASSAISTEITEIIQSSRSLLRSLLARLPRPLAFKELFLFQSGFCKQQSVEKTKVPRWLRKACGRLITQLFIARPRDLVEGQSSLRDLIVGVLDVHSTDPRHVPAVASALGHILATPPQVTEKNNTTEQYYRCLALQITDALRLDKNCQDATLHHIIQLVAIDTIHQICERDVELGKRLFLDGPLLSKLQRIVSCNDAQEESVVRDNPTSAIDLSDALELLSTEELADVINFIVKLLDTRNLSQALCCLLGRYSQPWFHFYSLLNLNYAKVEEDCQTSGSQETSFSQFRSKLHLILTSLLNSGQVSPLLLLRAWLRLPPLDPLTLKPLEMQHPTSCLSNPLPLRRAVVLRPASLVAPTTSEDAVFATSAPFRVCQAVEAVADHSIDMVSSRIFTTMLLLSPTPRTDEDDNKADAVDESSVTRLLSTWSTDDGKADEDRRPHNLAAVLLLSLISDINSALLQDSSAQSGENNRLRPEGVLTAVMEMERGMDATRALEVPLTASLLASTMLEQFDAASLWPSDPTLAVQLLSLTLSRLCLVLASSPDKEVLKMSQESLNLILGIAAFFVNYMEKGEKVASEVRDRFVELIPLLIRVEEICPQASASAELAQQIRIALCTRGAFSIPPSTAFDAPQTDRFSYPFGSPASKDGTDTKARLIEEIPSTPSPGHPTDVEHIGAEPPTSAQSAEMCPKLSNILEQLEDPLIPIRGHALIELSRLLEAKDSSIKGFEDRIYLVLVEHLDHKDSYVYLNAIRGLSAMGNAFTDRLLPLLLGRFRATSSGLEFRLKVGEAIVRVLRELGEIAPKYRDPVVSTLLTATRDPSEFIRAASLSNLAEICRLLRSAIQPIAYEVYDVTESSLKVDSSPLVRKSAAYLARSLFLTSSTSSEQGLPVHLPPDLIRDFHRLLRDRLLIERDEEVVEQLESAIAEVDARSRAAVFRPPDTAHDLVKEIRVLRPFNE